MSGNFLISPLLFEEFLVDSFFFSALWICHLTASGLHSFWWEVSSKFYWVPLVLVSHFSLAAFRSLSLSLSFDSLPMIYLGLDLFEFILLGIHCTSWRCGLMFFIKFGSFLAIISFSLPLSFLSFWDFAYAYVGMFYEVLKVS